MHSYASIHIHLHATALTTIWSVLGFQQTVPSQFLMIQNQKVITNTKPKPSARTVLFQNPVLKLAHFQNPNFSENRVPTHLVLSLKLSSFVDPGSDS